MARSLDLNADVGEGFPHDQALLSVISSANVACGFHAGDPTTMRRLCELCAERGVVVGRRSPTATGRVSAGRDVEIGYDDLLADLVEQRETLGAIAAAAVPRCGYLKPHGALYNRAVWDPEQAARSSTPQEVFRCSVFRTRCCSMCRRGRRPWGARVLRRPRLYARRNTGPRSDPGALVASPVLVAERVARLVETGTVAAVDGTAVPVEAESICVHGDTPDALAAGPGGRGRPCGARLAIEAFA